MVPRMATMIQRVKRRLRRMVSSSQKPTQKPAPAAASTKTAAPSAPAQGRAAIDREAWASAAQNGELGFHKRHNFRADQEVWWTHVQRDWQALGLEPTGWEGKTIIDVGAGSKLRSLYFQGAELIVLEPLADRYVEEVAWHDLDKADEMYSVPAEEFVPQLENRADLIVSINALDHGYNFEEGARNIRRYLKPDGLALLSFDMHDQPDEMHPLILTDEICTKIFTAAGFRIEKSEKGRRYHGAAGPQATHWWLRPA
jgi:2-polyprenyl-3-methyl-5-hydroxy-6-metoxy-1,4-benzoquinol methylase